MRRCLNGSVNGGSFEYTRSRSTRHAHASRDSLGGRAASFVTVESMQLGPARLSAESSSSTECGDRLRAVIEIAARGSPKHALSTTKVTEPYVVECGACTTAQVRVC